MKNKEFCPAGIYWSHMKCLTELESTLTVKSIYPSTPIPDWLSIATEPVPSHYAVANELCLKSSHCRPILEHQRNQRAVGRWACQVKCCVKRVQVYLETYLRAMSGIMKLTKIQSRSKKYVIEGSHVCLFDSVVNWVKIWPSTPCKFLWPPKLFFSLDELEQNL